MNLTILPKQKQIGQLQAHLDLIGKDINSILAPTIKFHEWLEAPIKTKSNLEYVAITALKLPLKAVRNIALSAYQIVRLALTLLVHPVITSKELMQSLKMRAKQLLDPQSWGAIGAAMIGSSISQFLVTATPMPIFGILAGEILIIASQLAAIVKPFVQMNENTPLHKAHDAAKHNLEVWGSTILESFTTGLLGGAIVGKAIGGVSNEWLFGSPYIHREWMFRWYPAMRYLTENVGRIPSTLVPPQVASFALNTPDSSSRRRWFSRK